MRSFYITILLGLLLLAAPMSAQNFSEGPYGTKPNQIAAPFTLPTTDGTWDFRAAWNDLDSYVFIPYLKGNAYGEALWRSDVQALFETSPMNVHYFFMSYATDTTIARNDVEEMKGLIDEMLFSFDDNIRTHWMSHIHYVPVPARKVGGWVNDVLKKTPTYTAIAIDRFQRLRIPGYLGQVTGQTNADFYFLGNEARRFNYEWQMTMSHTGTGGLVVPIFRNDSTAGTRYSGDVILPDAGTMAQFDKMEIELSLDCLTRTSKPCFEWDFLANLYVCDESDTTKCPDELGRWVTAYGREGKWFTDITPFLARLRNGGKHHFRFVTQDAWIVNAKLHLSNTGRSSTPYEIRPLWTGGDFNATYNDTKEPIKITVPEGTTAVQLVAIISGHGWGAEVANCAEFCNHEHHFSVNGTEFMQSYPMAGTSFGCQDQIDSGTVPNQYGTWYLGRGGWCPGKDVTPFIVDVTSAMKPGENTLEYMATVDGVPYEPQPSGSGQGFGARMDLNSWLVFWKAKAPAAVPSLLGEGDNLLFPASAAPNPVTHTAEIGYRVPAEGHVTLRLIDAAGNPAAMLVDADRAAGTYTTTIDAARFPSGAYLLVLETGGRSATQKLVIAE